MMSHIYSIHFSTERAAVSYLWLLEEMPFSLDVHRLYANTFTFLKKPLNKEDIIFIAMENISDILAFNWGINNHWGHHSW